MRTPRSFFLSRSLAAIAAVAAALILFAGCDSTGGLEDDPGVTVTAEETAASIAQSLAESTGGTADEFADAAAILGGAGASTTKDFSRSRDCSYDDSEQIWTCTVEVSGSRGRIDTAEFDRTYRVQFFAGDAVVRRSSEADSMTFEIVEGSGRFETARLDRSHTLIPATWAFSEASGDSFGIDLLSANAGRDATAEAVGRDSSRTRTRNAEVRKTRVEGLVYRENDGLVAGTIEGTYEADVEIERADGDTVSRSVSVTYVATFSADGAEIRFTGGGERFNGESFTFDRTTGALE
jgi:hypothetical protein